MKSIFFLLPLLLLTSCSTQYLSVQSTYLNRENLASYYVETPDPLLNNPPIGQRLIISWSFPKKYLSYPDLHLNLTVRLRDREQHTQLIPIHQACGTSIYEILNEKFCQTGGILTYKVTLMSDQDPLDEWKHPLWANLITFESTNTN